MQHKLSKGPLLNEQGHLNEAGYHTKLIKTYNKAAINASKLRVKEWDYYLVQTESYAVAVTVADNGYMGLLSVSYIDFEKPYFITKSKIIPLTLGKFNMPQSSTEGNVEIKRKGVHFKYSAEPSKRVLMVKYDNFHDHLPFELNATLTDEPKDSMVIAIPFKEKKTAFYYNQKILNMTADGEIIMDNKVKPFKHAHGLLDWGRGVWTYNNQWYWGAIQGFVNQKKVSFNLGYGFGDTSAASENMVFFDGKAHKLADISFNISKDEQGRLLFMDPWTVTSSDDRLKLYFKPIIDRKDYISLGVLKSDQHQVFGRFNGRVELDDGEEVEIKDFLGFLEYLKNKW